MPMLNKSGQFATTTVNGTEVPLKRWNVNPGIRVATTDNSLSGGFILASSSGGKEATFSFLIDHDFNANPFAAPLSLVVGQKITNVKLYLDGVAGSFWSFPSAVVVATPQDADHRGTDMIDETITCRNDGPFVYPGGVTP